MIPLIHLAEHGRDSFPAEQEQMWTTDRQLGTTRVQTTHRKQPQEDRINGGDLLPGCLPMLLQPGSWCVVLGGAAVQACRYMQTTYYSVSKYNKTSCTVAGGLQLPTDLLLLWQNL